jgi:hypothetical protein
LINFEETPIKPILRTTTLAIFTVLSFITRRDADDAVVMSLEFFNSLMETVYLLKSPANAAQNVPLLSLSRGKWCSEIC